MKPPSLNTTTSYPLSNKALEALEGVRAQIEKHKLMNDCHLSEFKAKILRYTKHPDTNIFLFGLSQVHQKVLKTWPTKEQVPPDFREAYNKLKDIALYNFSMPAIPEGQIRYMHLSRSPGKDVAHYPSMAQDYFDHGFKLKTSQLGSATNSFARGHEIELLEKHASAHTPSSDPRFRHGVAILMDIPEDLAKPLDNIPPRAFNAIMTDEFVKKYAPDLIRDEQGKCYAGTLQYIIPKECIIGALDEEGTFIPNLNYDKTKADAIAQEMRDNLQKNLNTDDMGLPKPPRLTTGQHPRINNPTTSNSCELF